MKIYVVGRQRAVGGPLCVVRNLAKAFKEAEVFYGLPGEPLSWVCDRSDRNYQNWTAKVDDDVDDERFTVYVNSYDLE